MLKKKGIRGIFLGVRKKEKQLIIIKDKKAITLTIIFLIILSIIMFKNFEIRNKDYTKIAECLVEKGVIMAGTETCHYCKAQKEMFNGAFEEVFAIKETTRTAITTKNGAKKTR